MRIAIGYLHQEVNGFSPVLTTLENFEANGIDYGRAILEKYASNEIGGFVRAAREASDVELAPTMAAWAIPSGKVERATHQVLKTRFLDELRKAGRLDGILLSFHGAMSAQGEYDVEGDLLEAIGREWGRDVPVAISLDHHASVTSKMVRGVAALTGYHTEPHVDQLETGFKAAQILFATVRGEVRPTLAWRKIPMIAAGNLLAPNGPLGEFFAEAEALEKRDRVLSVSIFPEFMYTDHPELGWTTVAVTDDAPGLAQNIADYLAEGIWARRHAFVETEVVSASEAVRRALAVEGGPVVLADRADATSAGTPGDSNAILKELIGRRLTGRALLTIVDPHAVEQAIEAGVGAEVTLAVGGSFDRVHHQPTNVQGRVTAVTDGRFVMGGPVMKGLWQNMKRTVVFESGDVSIVLSEAQAFNLDPSLYRSVGLEPTKSKIVVVKSPYLFRAAYEPIAKEIIVVDAPGLAPVDLRSIAHLYVAAPRPLFPLDDELFDPSARAWSEERASG